MQHGHLPEFVAASLAAHASHLAQHWLERAAAATPRAAGGREGGEGDASDAPTPVPEGERAEHVVRALAADVRTLAIVPRGAADERESGRRALAADATGAAVLPSAVPIAAPATGPAAGDAAPAPFAPQDARPAGEVMRLGWAAGGAAFAAGHSIHHVVRDADLLLAVILADVERAVADVPPGPGVTAADALAVARRLHRTTGRYAQAAVSGFVHALLRGLRERYRLLRHDLRNPLGTIRSALSLMEDETVPAETRHGPNIRAMVARNAGSLDRLISRRLDDAAATSLLAPSHEVGLRDVVLAARREVREAARLAGCDIVVEVPAEVPSRVDGASLELTLTSVLLAALARAGSGTVVRVACVGGAGDGPGTPCPVLRVDIARPGDERVPADDAGAPGAGTTSDGGDPALAGAAVLAALAPRWDEHGLALAHSLAQDYGGRLGVDSEVAPVRDAGALVAALAHAPTLYLRLPVVELSAPAAPAPAGHA